MKILSIETSSEKGSVALSVGGKVLSRPLLGAQQSHSATLLPMIETLLEAASCSLLSLDAIAFGAGPGAFTGVRLACGVAQGLGLGAQKPLVPVSCLAALAQMTRSQTANVLATRDARMGEIYWQCFKMRSGIPSGLTEPACAAADSLPKMPKGQWIGIGSGFKAWPHLATHFGEKLSSVNSEVEVDAQSLIPLAHHQLLTQGGVLASQAQPLYVRNKVALTTAERLEKGGRV